MCDCTNKSDGALALCPLLKEAYWSVLLTLRQLTVNELKCIM